MGAKGVVSTTPRSYHSTRSTTQRPHSIHARCGVGLSVDGRGLDLCIGPLSVTLYAGDPSSSAQPPYHPHTSPASRSDPGLSTPSPTSTISSETRDPTQLRPPTQSSTPPFASPPLTSQTANPNPPPTSSSFSRMSTNGAYIASGTSVGNGLSLTPSTGSDNGSGGASHSVAWDDFSPSTSTSSATSTVFSTFGASPPQTQSGDTADSWPSRDPLPLPDSPVSNPPSPHARLSIGAIIGIALGAFAVTVCAVLALLFTIRRRRAGRRSKRMSVESARHLEPYSYDDDSSRPVSSVWTAFGSVSVDPDFSSRREPSTSSLDFQFAEKDLGAYSPCPSPSPACAEMQPLARGLSLSSVHSLHDALSSSPSHLRVPPPSPFAQSLEAASSSEFLALAGTDYAVANLLNCGDGGLGRSVSGVSRVTAASGEVRGVEAL